VSAITPTYAFQDRTIDVAISGSGTSWDSKTKVVFANPKVTVNSVTVASASGLVANITVAGDAALGVTDVTVTDGASTSVFKGAFQIQSPLTVTVIPASGAPQGGLANLHVQMNDLTTPIDPDTFNATVSSPDVIVNLGTPSDYAFDVTLQANVLAKAGTFDLTVTFGATTTITSLAPQSFKVVTRAPTTLTSGATVKGMLNTELDTELYELTPASASQQFIQFTSTSVAGALQTTVIPKSGLWTDAITSYAVRYAQGTTSVDPFYAIISDSNGFLGPGPVPADTSIVVFTSPCTAASEETETAASNNDSYMTAEVVKALPALVSGTLGYGAVMPASDVDVYAITVPAGSTSIHAATGGDPADDTIINILDSTGKTVATSTGDDLQADLVYTVSGAGTYYVTVSPDTSATGSFSPEDNTYQLFIAVN
jgi:hypothetical protein